jgi:hypothetical protein
MDSQPRAFEASFTSIPEAGTPLPCHRPMIAQPVVVWTPARIIAALFLALVSVPAQLVPAAITRRRA